MVIVMRVKIFGEYDYRLKNPRTLFVKLITDHSGMYQPNHHTVLPRAEIFFEKVMSIEHLFTMKPFPLLP